MVTSTTDATGRKVFTEMDIDRLAEYRKEINELHQFVIDRAELYVNMHNKKDGFISFKRENGFGAEVYEHEIFAKQDTLRVVYKDYQYNSAKEYKVPYSFVFGAPTAEEKEYAEFLRLKEKFTV